MKQTENHSFLFARADNARDGINQSFLSKNRPLMWGGLLSLAAALLHIAIIVGGPAWYRFFGAGEALARLAEEGSAIPGAITALIAMILLTWSLYAFAGTGLIRPLPWLKGVLIGITAVYLVRGLALLPALMFMPQAVDSFLIASSLSCLAIGMLHLSGTHQLIWELS
ncbi:MAG: hypothetical protein ABW096_08980 [Candidatus Thiodiazotropha sp.]